MSTKLAKNFTVHDLKDEVLFFGSHWNRSFFWRKLVVVIDTAVHYPPHTTKRL